MNEVKKLIFVYNADAGLFSSMTDFAHKIVSPETYNCNLCKITYGNMMMKRAWKDYLDSLRYEKEFLHRNAFRQRYPELKEVALPAVFAQGQDQVRLFMGAEEINAVRDVEALKGEIQKKLDA